MRTRIGKVKQWWRCSRLEDVSDTETQNRGTQKPAAWLDDAPTRAYLRAYLHQLSFSS
jgi:hypothetical protein